VTPPAPEPVQRREGKAARKRVPRSSHAVWDPPADRPDPLALLEEQNAYRLEWLVPVRVQRMAESAFTFYRGGAVIMAADLVHTPTIDQSVQLCGDAHLANFGSFASPERRQVFDVNDFDETLPGPWEWDVKRLATSFVLAARDNGLGDLAARASAIRAAQAYRAGMREFATMPELDIWYAQVSLDELRAAAPDKATRKRIERSARKGRKRDSRRALRRLSERVDGQLRFRSQPPILVPLREWPERVGVDPVGVKHEIESSFLDYSKSVTPDVRHVLGRFRFVDVAVRVVGVGSVGTRCFVVLLEGRANGEPLILQIKEATASVLERHLQPSIYEHPGERVVTGQRMIQATSDLFLGWSRQTSGHYYYWRQFHDMKTSADIAAMDAERLAHYAFVCGWTLAHAHARSGNPAAIAGYLGRGTGFDRALGQFAVAYADQVERDYTAFISAIDAGRFDARPHAA
jgi:uncharacterized protein (DUF2252 family)